jgi:hypothetical protein
MLSSLPWETVNDTRGNDLGHGKNDKDESHLRVFARRLEIGNPRENRLSPSCASNIGRIWRSLNDYAYAREITNMVARVPRVSVENEELATPIPLKV